jgi:hypothetical protein
VFTARYALSPYIKQIRFVFNGLIAFAVMFTTGFVEILRCFYCFNIQRWFCCLLIGTGSIFMVTDGHGVLLLYWVLVVVALTSLRLVLLSLHEGVFKLSFVKSDALLPTEEKHGACVRVRWFSFMYIVGLGGMPLQNSCREFTPLITRRRLEKDSPAHCNHLLLVLCSYCSSCGVAVLGGLQPLQKLLSSFKFSKLLNKIFLWGGVVSPTPNPQPGGPGYPFLSGSSPLTCLAWEALPVATLPPA